MRRLFLDTPTDSQERVVHSFHRWCGDELSSPLREAFARTHLAEPTSLPGSTRERFSPRKGWNVDSSPV